MSSSCRKEEGDQDGPVFALGEPTPPLVPTGGRLSQQSIYFQNFPGRPQLTLPRILTTTASPGSKLLSHSESDVPSMGAQGPWSSILNGSSCREKGNLVRTPCRRVSHSFTVASPLTVPISPSSVLNSLSSPLSFLSFNSYINVAGDYGALPLGPYLAEINLSECPAALPQALGAGNLVGRRGAPSLLGVQAGAGAWACSWGKCSFKSATGMKQ